ncbi:hypothetical protein HMF7854_10800 [Sphingomonas ginkgonis]|uniref:Chitooligosaccharide deacetylase n=1 Tax=Sphingomonas ginkgonis TaxID=2315330 RepID=A0A3R9Y6L2_9SPHN|nr:polysaccharide deacetylase family protein [Sphingomonas ginkgonis]RST31269.1 hypothetical protein HMF7854_10800 [Sphingomonas ginkgonis]
MSTRVRNALAAVLLSIGLLFFVQLRSKPAVSVIPGLAGPTTRTLVPPPVAPHVEDYGGGGATRLGVLVTDVDSDWIGLVRSLRARGIPANFTRDPAEALRHRAVLAYPLISGKVLSGDQIRALAAFVHRGGGLMTFDLAGGGLEPLFGIRGEVPGRARSAIRWAGNSRREAASTPLNAQGMEAKLGSQGLAVSTAMVSARFDDGAPALTCRAAVGRACILGVDVGSYANRAFNLRAEPLAGGYVNGEAGGLDRLVDAVRDFYVASKPNAFLIGTAPAPYSGSLIVTHDLDAGKALTDALALSEALRRRKVDATFFMQTKYVRNWNDDVFFRADTLPQLRRLRAMGMEVGSHSVSHARAFNQFELGDGTEAYPDYRPFVSSQTTARGGTVLGELRVSKHLLDATTGQQTIAFRPGHLRNPEVLPQALAATGYRYTSDLTAQNALTNYPFQLAYGRHGPSLVPVWEFPVTIEDEAAPPFAARLGASIALVERIASHGGVATLLVHPDHGPKRDAELALIDRLRGRYWIGGLSRFGEWWRARDLSAIDYDGTHVTARGPLPIHSVTVFLPRSGKTLTIR